MKSLVERDHVINMLDKNGIDEWLTKVNYSRHLTDLKLKLGLKPTIEELMLRDPAKFPRTYKFLAKRWRAFPLSTVALPFT